VAETTGHATERTQGPQTPDTVADCERVLGPGHPLTTAARENYNAAAKT
jgi:hypothetical protein